MVYSCSHLSLTIVVSRVEIDGREHFRRMAKRIFSFHYVDGNSSGNGRCGDCSSNRQTAQDEHSL